MEALFSSLSRPLILILIVAVLVVLALVIVLARRLRRPGAAAEDPAQASIDGPIDYTSLPLEEEPKNWRERFTNLSLAGKTLLIVVPLLLIVGGAVALLLLQPPPPPPVVPTPVPVTMNIRTATLANAQTIRIVADTTGLPNDAEVRAELLVDGQPFPWYDPGSAVGQVRGNQVELSLRKLPDAPPASRAGAYLVRLSSDAGGEVMSAEANLEVPAIHARAFFGELQAIQPTATATTAPTATPAPEATPSPEPSPTAAPAAAGAPASVAGNGGNLRRFPLIIPGNIITQVKGGDQIGVLGRTPNREWYRVRLASGEEGWISATLVSLDPSAAAQVEPDAVVTVFVAGNVREQPDASSTVVGQVNRDEIVFLLQKTTAADWYQIRDVREVTGWVPANLLGIPEDIAAKVPVQGQVPGAPAAAAPAAPAAPSAAASAAAPAGLTGALTAPVVNNGDIRARPENDPDNVLSQVNAGEVAVLLQKTADGLWYRIRDARGIEGWVTVSLLRVAPEVAAKVPVGP